MVRLKKLKTEAERNRFAAEQLLNYGTPIDSDYLRQAFVYVIFRLSAPNVWIGGFVISTRHKRYLEVLTSEQLLQIHLPLNELVEITCIWKNKHGFISKWEVAQLYYYSIKEAFKTKKKFILAGTANDKIRRIQMTGFHRLLFKGNVNFYGETHFVWIYYCQRWEIFTGFFRYMNAFLW